MCFISPRVLTKIRRRDMAGLHRIWVSTLAWLCVCAGSVLAVRAQDKPREISVLGATDGRVKLLATTSTINMTLTIESTTAESLDVSVRASPLRDASGRL